MYKPDINTNDDRIDLFGTITLQPQINKTNAATLPIDSAFAKSVIVATTFDTELIDSTSSRINKSASFYLYTSWVARHLKNSSTTNTEKIYFITPQKLGITDSSNIILFLLPLKNHELLKKYGTIQWQWLSNAPVLFNNINIINHWQYLNYLHYAHPPFIKKYIPHKNKKRSNKYELQLYPFL